jgi:DNA-binding SARP family transcriptional activator
VGELRIRLLGGLDVEGVAPTELGSRKARTLVKLLALGRGAPVAADKVVEALWPGDDVPAKPVEQVGVLVSRLRSVLGSDRLARSDAGWALAVDWLDVAELEERVDEAAARLAAGNPGAARAAARAALTLVRGDLLADEPDPVWAAGDRASVARTVARARLVGAEAALAAGDAGEAAAVADGALDHDPYDELRCACSCGPMRRRAGRPRRWPPMPGSGNG